MEGERVLSSHQACRRPGWRADGAGLGARRRSFRRRRRAGRRAGAAGEAETASGGAGTAWGRVGGDLGPGESAGRAGAGGGVVTCRAVPRPPSRGGWRRSRGLAVAEMCRGAAEQAAS